MTANTVAGPLDRAHRSGSAGGDHQDPPAAVLRHGRTAHPLGPPPHPASSPALTLVNPVHSRPDPIPRHSSTSLSSLTARRRRPTRPPDNPGAAPQIHASPVRECRFWHPAWPISPTCATARRRLAASVATSHYPQPHLSESGLVCSPSHTHHPPCQRQHRIPSVDSGLGGADTLNIGCSLWQDCLCIVPSRVSYGSMPS